MRYYMKSLAVMSALLVLSAGTVAAEDTDPPAASPPETEAVAKQPKAEDFFQQGRDAMFTGQFEKAAELFRKAIEADKNGQTTTYRLHLARAFRYANQPKESEKLLTTILKESPDHVEAGQLLAEIYHGQKRWAEIAKVLEPLLKYRHDYPTYHLLAEATYNQDDYAKARKYYVEAIKLNSASGPDHYQLANIYLAENRFARAVVSYETALRLGLDSPVLHYKLASAYFNLRNYFGKVSVVKIAAGEAGTISGNWYLIERVPGQQDVFRVAPKNSAIYQIASAIGAGLEDRADVQMLRANTYLNARRYKNAYELYARIGSQITKEDKEDQALYHFYFAESAFGLGKYDEYLSHLDEAIKLDPKSYESALVDACINVAEKYNQAGQLDKYIEYLNRAVQQSPQTASLHLKLGYAHEEAHQYPLAVQQWRMVLDLEPDHPKRTELLNLIKKHSLTTAAASPVES